MDCKGFISFTLENVYRAIGFRKLLSANRMIYTIISFQQVAIAFVSLLFVKREKTVVCSRNCFVGETIKLRPFLIQ